jgi:two-component system response regulator DesR
MVSVLVAERREELRHVLVARLEVEPDIRVVATVARVEDAIELARRHRPEALIVDIAVLLADRTRHLHSLAEASPSSRLVILAVQDDAATRRVASAAGACAVVSVLDDPERLLEAIRDRRGEQS